MSSFYTPAELHTIAESLIAAVAAHSSSGTGTGTFSMLSQSPARSPLALPSALPAMSSANTTAGPIRPSAARRFEGKESTRRHSHDLRAMGQIDPHHHNHYHQQMDAERDRDRRGRDIQVKGLKK